MPSALDLTIVICTYRRNALLAKALASLARLAPVEGARLKVVVADNSDEAGARETVEAARAASGLDIAFVEAHPPNISVARNAGLDAARSAAIAFVDDDQELDESWLREVDAALSRFPQDVLLGRLDVKFETPERATPAIRRLFERPLDAPAGTELFAARGRNPSGYVLATSNAVLRRAAIGEERFDPAFGNGGGEDFDFYCRIERRGARFAWAPGMVARETVPASRCDPGYMRRRLYAGGQAYAAAIAGASDDPSATMRRLRLRALVQAGLLALAAPAALLRGRQARLDYGFRWAGVLGKLKGGPLYPVYREGDPAPARS